MAQDKEADGEEGSAPVHKKGLLKGVVILSEKKSMSHSFKARFAKETTVKLVQLYFSDQQTTLYKLDVIVSIGSK